MWWPIADLGWNYEAEIYTAYISLLPEVAKLLNVRRREAVACTAIVKPVSKKMVVA